MTMVRERADSGFFPDSFEFLSGKGCVYSFDPVGSYEREMCRAGGSAGSLIQPFLDNQVGWRGAERRAGLTLVPSPRSTSKTKRVWLRNRFRSIVCSRL